ncbi:hypothetical protein [Azoarcus sp. CIB]|uniref:hypothetical protein n=1 Tax=Aromatoleum sp. (strain CIB) TaxID=198107 RepID=UPI0012ED6ACF|nr:hypothetical protein [Azoarcus sp. CIB]
MNRRPDFTTTAPSHLVVEQSAWSPGVLSRTPTAFRLLETIHRPENVFPSAELVEDFARMTGMPMEELVMFRPARLALHEVIVRVTADIVVSEGESEEVFGQNFRRIADRILSHHVLPRMGEVERMHLDLRERVTHRVRAILAARLGPVAAPSAVRTFPSRLLARCRSIRSPDKIPGEREHSVVSGFKSDGLAASDPCERAIFKGLYRVLGAILAARGILGSDLQMLAELVTRYVCNHFGSRMIGEAIKEWIDVAVEQEGYQRVCNRAQPVLISLKGASAAGKSSIRPMIKRLMTDCGIEPDGYATISPDVWRRLLLDFESLGDAYKYAGYLTSREVMVIDGKLDRYIRDKANRAQAIPHLLVDRFRFDSFSSDEVSRILRDTYTRYVSTIHMYFLVTPPEETVERGWLRALERGRYKAVEDFLAHCVEAYRGMPKILFRWLGCSDVDYRYYFMDNRVPKGTFPKLIAAGNRDRMEIYDLEGMVNIERYQKINIHAHSRTEVHPPDAYADIQENVSFLHQCIRRVPSVVLVNSPDGRPYLEFSDKRFKVLDAQTLTAVLECNRLASILELLTPRNFLRAVEP